MPKLPNPGDVFSVIDKAGSVIDKGLDFIDKVSGRLDKLGFTESTIQETEKTPEIEPRSRTSSPTTGVSKLTSEETIAYQKREIAKELWQLEKHLAQGCRIPDKTGKRIPCDCCLSPDTIIYGSNRPDKMIRFSYKNDHGFVRSHTGTTYRVIGRYKRYYQGDMVHLRVSGNSDLLKLTPEHPVLIAKRNRTKVKPGDRNLQWIKATAVEPGDYIAFPRISKVTDRIDVTEALAELFGWYVAEGSKQRNRIVFTLGYQEKDNIERVKHLIKECFNAEPRLYQRPTGLHICYCLREDTLIFDAFGKGARRKTIPEWIINLPVAKQYSFLKGLYSGDGHVADNNIIFTTTSLNLAYLVRLLLFRLGFLHGIYIRSINKTKINGREIKPNGNRYDISVAGISAKKLADLLGLKYNGKPTTERGHVSRDFILLPILSKSINPYEGYVYNLGVDKNRSYLTSHGAVHNCEKGSWIAGLAYESIPIAERAGQTSDIFEKIASWAEELTPMVTVAAVESGQHDYKKLSGEASALRKKLMGSLALGSMIAPKEQITLDEAKKLAAEEAAREIEARWHSQEKK